VYVIGRLFTTSLNTEVIYGIDKNAFFSFTNCKNAVYSIARQIYLLKGVGFKVVALQSSDTNTYESASFFFLYFI
jgi:hypothetical protein